VVTRVYRMEDLEDAAEMVREGPPWWFHALLLSLISLLAAAMMIVAVLLAVSVAD